MNNNLQLIDVLHPPIEGPARETRVLAEMEGLKLVAITLRPGGELPDHVAPGPITVQVVVGRVAITVAGETQELAPGRIAVLAAGVHHALRQLGDDPTLILLSRCPAPASKP